MDDSLDNLNGFHTVSFLRSGDILGLHVIPTFNSYVFRKINRNIQFLMYVLHLVWLKIKLDIKLPVHFTVRHFTSKDAIGFLGR